MPSAAPVQNSQDKIVIDVEKSVLHTQGMRAGSLSHFIRR